MKKLGIILLCILFPLIGHTQQSAKEKRAREMYSEARNTFDPMKKISILRKALLEDKEFVEAYWLLSATFKDVGDEVNTIYYLDKAARPDYRLYPETILRLGKAYFSFGQYENALKTFVIFDQRYQDWLKRCQYAIELKRNPIPYNPINLDAINTDFDDYWPSITADEQNISTTVKVGQREGQFSYMAQEDIYHSQKINGKWTESFPVGAPLNTPGNEGAQSFSVDGRYMFFVACDRRSGIGGCDIYYSIRKGDQWGPPINAGKPLNSFEWDNNPSFTSSGDELFFSSKRPGGKGKMDIWSCKVAILEDGRLQFSEPKNLGDSINTPDEEYSPFIHPDNKTLYFSSDGHYGLGGLDIFYAKRKPDGTWSKPTNLGYPLNTHRNEIGFVVNASGEKGYFSSNGILRNGRGADIYEIELPLNLRPERMEYFKGKVYDAATKRAIQAQIEVFKLENNELVFQSVSDEKTGEFTACLPVKNKYGYFISKKGYMFYSGDVSKIDSMHVIALQVALDEIAVGEKVILNNVFFDFDKDDLKPESVAELERLIRFLKVNSTVSIELGGHTDNKGSREYNLVLSNNRAKAVADYLIKRGVSDKRISYQGYGFDRPIADNATDQGRAQNRRTEVIITKK